MTDWKPVKFRTKRDDKDDAARAMLKALHMIASPPPLSTFDDIEAWARAAIKLAEEAGITTGEG